MHVLQEVNIIKNNFNVILVKMPVLEEEIPINLHNDLQDQDQGKKQTKRIKESKK